jgi:hypothetical protein
MQDPLHYPHGTKWMAPGPLGQVHPLPDDENIKLEMMRVARNHKHIYDMYNFGELGGEGALCVFGERWGGGVIGLPGGPVWNVCFPCWQV